MSLHYFCRLLTSFDEIVEISFQVNRDDQAIASAQRPCHANLLVWDADHIFLSHPPRLNILARLHIPDSDSLVCARCDKSLRIFSPAYAKYASCMRALANLRLRLSSPAVIQPDLLVCANSDQQTPIRAESSSKDKSIVLLPQRVVELERCAMVKHHARIIAARCSS